MFSGNPVVRKLRAGACVGVLAAGLGASAASASQVGYEGTEIVVRADDGEPMGGFSVTVDEAAGTLLARDGTAEPTGYPGGTRERPAPRGGAGCSAATTPEGFASTACPLAGATGVRVEWAGAVPSALGHALPGKPAMNVGIGGGSLPVVYHGGPAAEGVTLTTTGSVTVDTGDGNDFINVIGPTASVLAGAGDDELWVGGGSPVATGRWLADAGPGNDLVSSGLPDDGVVLGGPGDDILNVSTWNADPETQARQPIRRQRVDCGEGADRLTADAADVAGPSCAPTPSGLQEGMTLGRFDRAGIVHLAVGRLTRAADLQFGLSGPRPPAFTSSFRLGDVAYGKPAATTRSRFRGAIRADVRTVPSVRKRMRTRRQPVRGARVSFVMRGGGDHAGDTTSATVGGVLRPAA
jgi:hypothetical protein